MAKLFKILSIFFVVLGLLSFPAGASAVGMFFIAVGMIGIAIVAYHR